MAKIRIKRFQQGGQMAPPAPSGGGDPIAQLASMAQSAVQSQDCQAAMQVCQVLIQAIGGSPQQEPAPAGPAEQVTPPAPEAEGEPVFRRGGVLTARLKR